jgi:hypothetical protein
MLSGFYSESQQFRRRCIFQVAGWTRIRHPCSLENQNSKSFTCEPCTYCFEFWHKIPCVEQLK